MERLANRAFNMTVNSMADYPEFERPFHEACSRKKVVCPEASCQKENLFFEENELGHHFRTIHKKRNAKVVSKAVVKTRELLNTLLLSQNGNRRLVYALFMFFDLSETVVMQSVSTGSHVVSSDLFKSVFTCIVGLVKVHTVF